MHYHLILGPLYISAILIAKEEFMLTREEAIALFGRGPKCGYLEKLGTNPSPSLFQYDSL